MHLGRVVALIPAYRPTSDLVPLVDDLAAAGFREIIVVDDGSGAGCAEVFRQIDKRPRTRVLHHAVNLGKGAALKTGLNAVAVFHGDAIGVVTLDADGQHGVDDVVAVAEALAQQGEDALIIGARRFDAPAIPFRSRFGNELTKHLVRWLIGIRLGDTQSGLRGIPMGLARRLLPLKSQRYEFELEMLILCRMLGVKIREIVIKTIYIGNNERSHFSPVLDSLRIYLVLFRFFGASAAGAIVDNAAFALAHLATGEILMSQIGGRCISLLVNYNIVRDFVFKSDGDHGVAFSKYLGLAVVSGALSYLMIRALADNFGTPVILAKIWIESAIFFVNFAAQREFVFRKSSSA